MPWNNQKQKTVKNKIQSILQSVDLTGFTQQIDGWKTKRYIVAFTNNATRSIEKLCKQISQHSVFDWLTIGGRTDTDWSVYIDVGTSTNELSQAQAIGNKYGQQAIRDNHEQREIRL